MESRAGGAAEARAWAAVAALSVGIFATVPIARAVQHALDGVGGRVWFLVVVLAGFAAGLALVLRSLRRQGATGRHQAVWVATAAVYAGAAFALRDAPEESIHLLEYGGLGILAWRALGFRIADAWRLLGAAAVGSTIGLLDEGFQWLTPERHWDLRDLAINASAASGVQLALAFGLPAAAPHPGAGPGRRLAASLGLLAWILFGLCLVNTPARIDAYGRWLPGFQAVRERGDMMIEYGFAHADPVAGRFRSRFRLDELARVDRERAASAGALLAERGHDDDYGEFLATFNPITDPFLHELRVHLFRRDRYMQTARMHEDEGDRRWARKDWTVAHRENAVLERYFGQTLAAGGRRLPEEERRRLEELQHPDVDYLSPVSRGLLTEWRESTAAAGAAVGALAWALLAAWPRRDDA